MTKTPENDIIAGPQAVDVNAADGGAELTEKTAAELRDICDQTGEPFDGSLTEGQARRRIIALKEAHDLD
ncbi:DUF3072 domain-containing protein [Roseobacter ponti]|uniref:DUF3072 domain-containing protein n=1 Tax=Roseobacter ponti TaxID=1891787 RepID=A0A858SU38_9RHOB|nr:DUF3072 domain-containing protein [Roseobacter ponti]QJF52195.1 DUF3072 domain-containing protein [Roseobacter ponti]